MRRQQIQAVAKKISRINKSTPPMMYISVGVALADPIVAAVVASGATVVAV